MFESITFDDAPLASTLELLSMRCCLLAKLSVLQGGIQLLTPYLILCRAGLHVTSSFCYCYNKYAWGDREASVPGS